MKYDMGDMVVIRNDLLIGEFYGPNSVVPDMLGFGGKVLEVDRAINHQEMYRLVGSDYYWTDDMINHKESEKLNQVDDDMKRYDSNIYFRVKLDESPYNESYYNGMVGELVDNYGTFKRLFFGEMVGSAIIYTKYLEPVKLDVNVNDGR